MKIIDLSMPLDNKTPAYPGDPQIEINQIAEVGKDGWSERRIDINSHCGTHVDAPAHMLSEAKTLDDLSLSKFFGEGVLIDVRNKDKIDLDCLKDVKISKDSVVVFLTGQSDKMYINYYDEAKIVPEEVAQRLVELEVKAVGIDSFSPDQEPYNIHKILLPHDILLIENLVNLKELVGKRFKIYYFPLRISNGDGAPCRAVAIIDDVEFLE